MKSYAICTLGCKVNTYEAQSVNQQLQQKGYIEKDFKDVCDIYIIFTCAVTNTAASKSRQKIHQAIRQNKDAIICVVGCYVQIDVANLKKDEHIDILIGSKYKDRLVEYIERYQDRQLNLVEDLKDVAFEKLTVDTFNHQTRAYLKIQDGCNQYCSYCIIPYARGKERSMPYQEVIQEAKELSKHHQEIVLTGIHTGRYGKEYGVSLAALIKMILQEVKDIKRIRISSIEITEIDDELIELIKNDQRVAAHLHIPLQAGDDVTLKRMNRPYTCAEFLQRINEIRENIPFISISTDLIVGFVNESEEEFAHTYEFLKQCQFSFIHVFPYAMKKGTKASFMSGHLDNATKKLRSNQCLELSHDLNYVFMSKFINQEVEVLVEGYDGKYAYGYTSEYIYVYIDAKLAANTLVKACITHIEKDRAYAKVVE
ncbi:MAG: tRNA (N(6)-L-threonylcarbamoyladenosine(37)-C(2))-methylthiotransferase MtaB [Erysipelotrichaceae bacterium]|nr:tRNA (N(6)-L-threonylcarbamoyladenosine(37)-C(2))-methylthiotransferase MtaB [Erysipelotrichaceae bacterium]MDY5252250.1 tRNA (N(6)-L-threonylcarbamoyladenosine(37)-C(2))-methylthiotransferase MtaB [Erysipelotrichaceae bacterium]